VSPSEPDCSARSETPGQYAHRDAHTLGTKRAKPYHSLVDALDTWLNTQRGWRHFALAWLTSLPAGVALSLVWAGTSMLFGPTTLGPSADLERMALGVVASVFLAVLGFTIESRSRRRPSKRGKNRTPRYLWRGIVGIYSLIGGGALSMIAASETSQWRRHHPYLVIAELVLYAIAMALTIWNLQYWRRVQRQTAELALNDLGSPSGPLRERSDEGRGRAGFAIRLPTSRVPK
jgi:hypothetical protein